MKQKNKWTDRAKQRLRVRRLNEQLRNYESLAKTAPSALGRQIGREGAEKIIAQLNAIKETKP